MEGIATPTIITPNMPLVVDVRNAEQPGRWVVTKDFWYKGHVVSAGFDTDGASIPWIMQPLIKKGGRCFPAAVVHDYYYATGDIPRYDADWLFREMLCYNGVNPEKAELMYRAVRLWGWRFYQG